MSIKDVVILGAGASASDGAPVQSQLFQSYFKESVNGTDEFTKEIEQFFKHFFGIDPWRIEDHTEFPTFEEVLGILEIAISREESFRNYPLMPSAPKIQNARERIVFLIARILQETLQQNITKHNELVLNLHRNNKLLTTAFISLNYDILIDNALTRMYDDVDLDYGVEFTNFQRVDDWRPPRPDKSVNLLKLHGSLNWLYCPTCASLTITPKDKAVSTLVDHPIECDDCGSNMVPIVIPPTFFKVMSNYFLQTIWRKAEGVLLETERLIFCGYSFPDADIHIRYLLKRVEINRNDTPEVFIINCHEHKDEHEKGIEENRYRRFFSRKDRIHYLTNSFEDFCEQGEEILEL
ncbi:MAG: SIR2 family protein [Proteobacteria bacterium]|nr:SIR2 family protein [Pseudomonadota bacterium]MBU1739965.1 SIR2 family protein [Pseudomonadota bacterium]